MQYSKPELEKILSDLILTTIEQDKPNLDKVSEIISTIKSQRLLIEKIIDSSFTSTSRLRTSELVHGVGVVDIQITEDCKGAYETWRHMLRRSYAAEYKNRKASYEKCLVSDEWLTFSEFLKFYQQHNKLGFQLDKDILVEGNKLYSKETCCFVPTTINGIIVNLNGAGVYFEKSKQKYRATISIKGVKKNLGNYNSFEEASKVYRLAKKNYITETADEYLLKGEISDKIANALKSRVSTW